MELYGNVNNFALPNPGNHLAICSGVIHIGTGPETYEGHTKMQDRVVVLVELVKTNHVFDEKKGPEPFIVRQKYTNSMGTTAKLRKVLEGWRGEPFTNDEAQKFNIFSIAGAPCMVNIIKKTSAGGKDRVEIQSISQVPEELIENFPAQRTKMLVWGFPNIGKGEKFDTEGFNRIPTFFQEEIKKSDQYKLLAGSGSTTPAPTQNAAPVASGTAKKLPF